ncbi:hypothetical protein CPB84DRAFT_1778375 [Gymnopilus junonius]|uniref:Uncharacterized protein n=1 Tax=Gymnopilus junonius TaxID=109634 RepID=A0A9P5TMG9_GYMJU|nr:hypothetical protein CPB84DRAFT_1778375 [Gymnopilus junonius]
MDERFPIYRCVIYSVQKDSSVPYGCSLCSFVIDCARDSQCDQSVNDGWVYLRKDRTEGHGFRRLLHSWFVLSFLFFVHAMHRSVRSGGSDPGPFKSGMNAEKTDARLAASCSSLFDRFLRCRRDQHPKCSYITFSRSIPFLCSSESHTQQEPTSRRSLPTLYPCLKYRDSPFLLLPRLAFTSLP